MAGVTIMASRGSFTSCTCWRSVWPLLEALCEAYGITVPRVSQSSYQPVTSFSASTHVGGGVIDLTNPTRALDDLLEELGCASYIRTEADGFAPHIHAILTGCAHLHSSAQRQVQSWLDGRNGLVSNLPDRDTTRPANLRNWQEGVVWARRELQRIEDNMPLSDADVAKVAKATTDKLLGQLLGLSGPTVGVALQATYRNARNAAAAQGVDVDEAAIAAGLAASVGPLVRDAVVAAAQAGGTPDAIADAVLGKLGAALAPVLA